MTAQTIDTRTSPPLGPTRGWAAFRCCDVRIDSLDVQQACNVILRSTRTGGHAIHLCNSYTLALAVTDKRFRDLLNRSYLNIPDGTPLSWVAKQVVPDAAGAAGRGPDVMREVLVQGRQTGTRHFFYGCNDEVLAALVASAERLAPGLSIVGCLAPPYRPLVEADWDEAAAAILASGADVVWVGLGTPLQDYATDELAARTDSLVIPVGAAFDFLAGSKKEAPRFVRNTGFEWLFRLLCEPRRLFRRYLFGNLNFLRGLVTQGVHVS